MPPTSKNRREKTADKESSGAVTTSATGSTRPGAAPKPRLATGMGPTDIRTCTTGNQPSNPAPGRTQTTASHHVKGDRQETTAVVAATTVIPSQTNKPSPTDSARAGVARPKTTAATTVVTSRTSQPRSTDSAPLGLPRQGTTKANTATERPKIATSASTDDGSQGNSRQPPSPSHGQGVFSVRESGTSAKSPDAQKGYWKNMLGSSRRFYF